MFGTSYVGATQLLAAISAPPHLTAICPVVSAADFHNLPESLRPLVKTLEKYAASKRMQYDEAGLDARAARRKRNSRRRADAWVRATSHRPSRLGVAGRPT